MTSPERIEELLQIFGKTLDDLPKLQAGNIAVYDQDQRAEMKKAALKWHGRTDPGFYEIEDFCCHQCDVIEKLVSALETANKRYSSIREYIECMSNSVKPFEDSRDAGYDDACIDMLEYIDELETKSNK